VISFPVTGGIAILAVAVSLGWWAHRVPVEALEMTSAAWHGQPWRLWTCALPHAGVLHLVFDVYWVWVFGTLVEESFGSLATLGIYLVLAGGSAAAEWALASGGVGLSGVGYGLFGLLWVLSRRSERFAEAIDRQTINLFIGWFFLCIVLTAFDVLPVANVAHGSGCLLGILLGFMIADRPARRIAWGLAIALFLAAAGVFASVLRPMVNLSKFGGYDEFQQGYDALTSGQNESAATHLRRAVAYRHADATYWYDLGIAEERLGHAPAALSAYQRASAMQPESAEFRSAVRSMQSQ
jgi:membrane associated rhomboid family serine protease